LDYSYRLPSRVHAVASRIASGISNRRPKQFRPRDDHEGMVCHISDVEELDLSSGNWLILARNAYLLNPAERICESAGYPYDSRKSPLRHESVKAIRLYEIFRATGTVPDSDGLKLIRRFYPRFDAVGEHGPWFDTFIRLGRELADYFRLCLSRGESIVKPPRIVISTIHGVKGGEADNVAVMTDVSYRTYQELQENPDDELRVFYVAVTRAKESLYIIEPRTPNAIEIW